MNNIWPNTFIDVYEFVKQNTQNFDESHDVKHALKVYENALKIVEYDYTSSTYVKLDKDIIMFAAMLHDVCDHKYPDSISLVELKRFISSKLGNGKANTIMEIIDNISYSKEVRGDRKDVHHPYLDIISDADKLEAIGRQGIYRCYAYSKTKNPNLDEDSIKTLVKIHCREKLLKLKDEYIRTTAGKAMAIPLHEDVIEWMVAN